MSFGRAAGPILATICGVCTAYAAFGPEFQKQAAERDFATTHPNPTDQTAAAAAATVTEIPQQRTIIDNDASIGASVKDALQQTKAEIAPKSAWSGLGLFQGVFGGADSTKTTSDSKAEGDKST